MYVSGASSLLWTLMGHVSLSFTEETSPFCLKFLSFGLTQSSPSKLREVNVHRDDFISSRPTSWSTNGLSPSRVMESVVSSSALSSHYGAALNPICMLGSRRVGPIIERNRSWDSSVDYCLSKGRIQSSSEQEHCSSGVLFPLHDVPKVIEGCNVRVKIFPLHLDGQ